jgi:hypothetical protein
MQSSHVLPPALTQLARQLLLHEADERLEPAALGDAIEHVYAKFRRRLVDLIGQTGFSALFSRALHLARRESAQLTAISVDAAAPQQLLGAHEFAVAHASDAAAAFTAIVAHFIWLLLTFIGEQLSIQLITDIWPQLATAIAAPGGADS